MEFHKTSLKLAGFYLAVLMTISLFFSASIYQVSMNELERGLRRPAMSLARPGNTASGFLEDVRREFESDRIQAYDSAQNRILTRLIVINVFIFIGGGLLCYYLAARTLRPIEEAHEAQNRFTADASHELRTPITAMLSETEVALMDSGLTLIDAKAQLKSNIEELEKLTALSEGLLRLAHADNNALITTKIAAKNIVDAAIDRVSAHAKSRDIIVTVQVTEDTMILGDEISATEALVTLLDNAIKYSPEKSEITCTVSNDQKFVYFTVSDRGIGIEPEELKHIFERFYRADSSRTKQHTSGYGLGLAIAKSIADAHGGSITAKSTQGKGSEFTLALPQANS